MRIWKTLHNKFPDWYFDVVGDGKDKAWMERYCISNNMHRVSFHGYQEPKPFLMKAKVFTMTSDFEGFPMVLVEAQAFGLVPVAFESFSSLRDIIKNNSSGIIVKPFDEEVYINEVADLIGENKRLLQMAENSARKVKEFEASQIASLWKKILT